MSVTGRGAGRKTPSDETIPQHAGTLIWSPMGPNKVDRA